MNEVTIRLNVSDLIESLEPTLRPIVREEIDSTLRLSEPESASPPAKDLMTTKEVAQYLGVSTITLYRLRQDGRIGYFRVANRVLFSHAEHIKPFLAGAGMRPRAR